MLRLGFRGYLNKEVMKNYVLLAMSIFMFSVVSCKDDKNSNAPVRETILKGSTSIIVDETLLPIIEDQIEVFESAYDATITAVPRSEAEAIRSFTQDTANIVILARKLTDQELKIFEQKKIIAKQTKFASDGIALIANQRSKDSVIDMASVVAFMKGEKSTAIKGLVFDNPNSSTARYITEMASLKALPESGVFSFSTNSEAIKFISENEGMIGVVGLNWLVEPTEDNQSILKNVKVLGVKGIGGTEFVTPSQNNIAEGRYPLARDLFIINAQGFAGLGMGFGSFITGERGQRIILKSGLLPVRMPGRKIIIKDNKSQKK